MPDFELATRHHIRFVEQVAPGQAVLMEFVDPANCKAVGVAVEPGAMLTDSDRIAGEGIDILAVPGQPNDSSGTFDKLLAWVLEAHTAGTPPPITFTLHGAQVVWHSRRVAILAAAERMESLLLALVDFSYYERELARLERATADSWAQLECDTPLAFEVTARDLERRESVGRQTQRMLTVRMRYARIAPRLNRRGTNLPSLAHQLGERLREKSRVDERLETLANQLEVFEHVYELSSQRFSEFQTSRRETTLEWVIIVLLAAETMMLLIDLLWSLGA